MSAMLENQMIKFFVFGLHLLLSEGNYLLGNKEKIAQNALKADLKQNHMHNSMNSTFNDVTKSERAFAHAHNL